MGSAPLLLPFRTHVAFSYLLSQSKFTHIASGFGKATVTSKIVSNTYAVISVSSSALGPNIIQSYVVKSGTPTIFMTTSRPFRSFSRVGGLLTCNVFFPDYDGEPSVGELRFLARLRRAALPNGPKAADMLACKNDVVEGSDVFRCSDGTTRSKCASRGKVLAFPSAADLLISFFADYVGLSARQ